MLSSVNGRSAALPRLTVGVLALLACLQIAIAPAACATLTNVDEATDICSSTADPCVLTQPAEVVAGATLDFGTRGFEIRSSGRLDVGTGVVTLRCGNLKLTTTGVAISLSGPDGFGGTRGGALSVQVQRRCSGNTTLLCVADTQCAAVGAGTCSVGSGAATLAGKIAGNASSPAALILRAAGPIQVTQSIQLNGDTTEADGGTIDLRSHDSVAIQALVSADSGGLAAGGEVSISATLDVTASAVLDVTGGDLDGGILELTAGRDIIVTEDVNVSASAGGGFGGEIMMDAGRDLRIEGGSGTNRVLLSNDGHESVDLFGGDGGAHDYSAGRNAYFGQYVRCTSDGSAPDGFGDFISVLAGGDVTIDGIINARSIGAYGGGGELDVDASGQVTISALSQITVAGGQSGGGDVFVSGDAGLVFNGAVDVSAAYGGGSGDASFDSGGDATIAGSVKIGGAPTTVIHGASVTGCRVELAAGTDIDNSSANGRNDFTSRERFTLDAGARVAADAATGSNVITYRTSAKPPVLAGVMTPAPVLKVNGTLSGCPVCGNGEIDAGESCDDGNRSGGDGCSADCQDEGCVAATPGYPSVPLCADADPCTLDSCNSQLHVCEHPRSCDDGIDCTNDTCVGNECQHTPSDALCASGTVCATGFCNTVTGCVFSPVAGPCNDGLFCNGSDTCGNGTCSVHTGNPCTGNIECRNLCDESARKCQSPAGTPCSSDGRECTADFCNGVGSCIHPDRSGPCDDGVFCNGMDACSVGECNLHAGDPCNGECQNTCDEAATMCTDPVGTPCSDDGNFCTDDTCDGAGGCSHHLYRSLAAANASVVRKAGAPNDTFSFKAAFAIAEFTTAPTVSGLRFAMADDTGTTIFSSDLPAAGFVDVKGDGTQYRFRDTTGTLAGANGVFLALVRRNLTQGTVLVRLKARDHEVPGVVNQPAVSVALGFGSDTGSCFGGLAVPCLARGSRVSCKR